MRYTEDFPYLSLCGKERNYVRCEDMPIVFNDVIDDNLLSYNHGSRFLTVDFQPDKISMVPDTGRIYHPGPEKVGGLGLLSDKLGIQWTAVSFLNLFLNVQEFTFCFRREDSYLAMVKKTHQRLSSGTAKN